MGAFIKINADCAADIEEHCSGMFFEGDTMTCLTQRKDDSLGDDCKAALPKKEAASDENDDAEKAAWRAKRKAARGQAMKDIEKEKKAKAAEEKKKRRRRR